MNLKKRLLKNCRLYLVLDKDTAGKRDLAWIAARAVQGGVNILQLRWKKGSVKKILEVGRKLRLITRRRKVLFIINDRVDLAMALNADGVHLGQEDLDIKEARRLLGSDMLIGLSTHSPRQARRAVLDGADYISIGPIFKTPLKSNYGGIGLTAVRIIQRKSGIPFFAIGGIDLNNLRKVLDAGANRVAVVRAIVKAEDPYRASHLLSQGLN